MRYRQFFENKYGNYYRFLEDNETSPLAKTLKTLGGLVRVLSLSGNVEFKGYKVDGRGELYLDVSMINPLNNKGTKIIHSFNVSQLANNSTSMMAYTDRKLVLDVLHSSFLNRNNDKWFTNTLNGLTATKNYYTHFAQVNRSAFNAVKMLGRYGSNDSDIVDFVNKELNPNFKTNDIASSQALLVSDFCAIRNGEYIKPDFVEVANDISYMLLPEDCKFRGKPSSYATSKSNKIFELQEDINHSLKSLNNIVQQEVEYSGFDRKPQEMQIDFNAVNNGNYDTLVEVALHEAYDMVLVTPLMEDPIEVPTSND